MVVEYDWYILHAMQYINVSEYAKCIFWVCGWANFEKTGTGRKSCMRGRGGGQMNYRFDGNVYMMRTHIVH